MPTGWRGSRPSYPAITVSISAASATVRVIGPRWSMVSSMGNAPVYGTSPWVGLWPTVPLKALGIRTDPPWSPPVAMSTAPDATSAALPDDDPPDERDGFHGFRTGAG